MSSTCSSWRRCSPRMACASSGSKPSIVIVVRNIGRGPPGGWEVGRVVYRMEAGPARPTKASTRRRAPLRQHVLDNGIPSLRKVGAVVTATAECEHTAVTEPLGELGQLSSCPTVGLGGQAQVG